MQNKETEARIFNPDMLVMARKSKGLTQSEMATALSMTSSHLSKIEAGIATFPDAKLKTLCEVLRYREDFFFRSDRFLGIGPTISHHRMRQSVSSKLLEVNVYRIHIERLLRSVDIAECKIPSYDLDDLDDLDEQHDHPEKIARTVRASWFLPSGPVRDLVKIVEEVGGIVIPYDFGTKKIDGLSQWVRPLPPLFFINKNIPGDRWRFSLAHELGHIIMHHSSPRDNMEREADRFAAELLMPSQEIEPWLNSVSFNKLLDLKVYWKVSMQAIIKRAKDLGSIPERTAYYLFAQMSKAGYRTKEPGEFQREQPTTLSKIIEVYLNTWGWSVSQMSQLLAIYDDEFYDLYDAKKSHLRLAN